MKFALIAPTGERGAQLIADTLLTYHMALAQYVLSDDQYCRRYQALRRHDHFIMLDNGAAEGGHSIGIENVVEAARLIGGVDEIVMPDVLDEMNATITATANALQYVPQRMRAVVPQGKDWDEWEQCATHLVAMGCRTICIAKRYEKLPGGRPYAIGLIRNHDWDRTHDVHLLGCHRNPLKEVGRIAKVAPWVRGIDTAAPISYAQHRNTLDEAVWRSLDWGCVYYYDVALRNVELMLDACHT